MSQISNIKARPILDSRGNWTIEVEVALKNGVRTTASVPQGKSTGANEVEIVSAARAIKNIEKFILPKLKGKNILHERELDELMTRLDGTPNKRRLGGNAILGVSMACVKAAAEASGVPLWKRVRELSGLAVKQTQSGVIYPRLFINVVNGGLHAGNNLDFQEYLVIPKARTFRESIFIGTQVYHALGKYLSRVQGKAAANVGDEGGYAPNFKDNLEPFGILRRVVKSLRLKNRVDFGLDSAANGIKIPNKKLFDLYRRLARDPQFIYIEDPFDEEDFLEFSALKATIGEKIMIAGDDLTTTSVSRMEKAHAEGSVNAVIIKPNQIGTVSEALGAVRLARKYEWSVVVSHRSGETNDDFIADFAYGVGADGLKLGAPARGERIAKYNRLLEIERTGPPYCITFQM